MTTTPPEGDKPKPAPKRRTPTRKKPPTGMLSDRAANIITGVVTAVWAAATIAGMIHFRGYQTPETINGLFFTIVGSAFVLRNRGKGE